MAVTIVLSALVAAFAAAYAWERRRARESRLENAALTRISGSIDDYLYTNEHLPGGSRRSIFSGPNRSRLMGGEPPAGCDVATEWARLVHPEDWEQHLGHQERLRAGEPSEVTYRLRGYDGEIRWIRARTRPHRSGSRLFVDGIVSDVTTEKLAEEALASAEEQLRRQLELNAYQANHDALTSLPNRRRLLQDLEALLAQPSPPPATLFLGDLDGFKLYNDSYGHPAGDALLIRLGRRLESVVGSSGTVYRLAGDEFCVLARSAAGDEFLDALTSAVSEQGHGFCVSGTWGMVELPAEASDTVTALSVADRRLYERKQPGRRSTTSQITDVLRAALTERDANLGTHLHEIAELATRVGAALGMSEEDLERVRAAAQLHDIGKIAIPERILDKPASLSPSEWEFVRQHTLIGERIVAAAPSLIGVGRLIRSSHERFDGGGYPDGLEGEDIPLGARIVAVCDAFEAMTSERPYAAARPAWMAVAELHRCAGTQFDPQVVAAFAEAHGALDAGEHAAA